MDLEDIAKTTAELRAFEAEMVELYHEKKVKPPVQFSYGNEEPLIEIFRQIKPEDWICTTYRNHYHALLREIPKEEIRQHLFEGRSMDLMSATYKFITSAIVGGTLPIAVGLALALKRQNSPNKVWAFCGDMAAWNGLFAECTAYAEGHHLPITFVIEDNGMSVDTPTQVVWGDAKPIYRSNVIHYSYKNKFPHQGADKMQVGF